MSGERLHGVRLFVDLEDPIDEPGIEEVLTQVRRLRYPRTYSVSMDRVDHTDASSIDCSWSSWGWWVTTCGNRPTDVAQGKVRTEAAAVDLLVSWARDGGAWQPPSVMRSLGAEAFPAIDMAPHHWVRHWWEDKEIASFYEVNRDGVVLRAVELRGSHHTPTAAASRAEWRGCQRGVLQPQTPTSLRYALRYGSVPEGVEGEWGATPRDPITADDFEERWQQARAHLRDHPRGYP